MSPAYSPDAPGGRASGPAAVASSYEDSLLDGLASPGILSRFGPVLEDKENFVPEDKSGPGGKTDVKPSFSLRVSLSGPTPAGALRDSHEDADTRPLSSTVFPYPSISLPKEESPLANFGSSPTKSADHHRKHSRNRSTGAVGYTHTPQRAARLRQNHADAIPMPPLSATKKAGSVAPKPRSRLALLPEVLTGLLFPSSLLLLDNSDLLGRSLLAEPSSSKATDELLSVTILAAGGLMLYGIISLIAVSRTQTWDASILSLAASSLEQKLEIARGITLRATQAIAPFFAATRLGAIPVVLILLAAYGAGIGHDPRAVKTRKVAAVFRVTARDSPACAWVLSALYSILAIQILSSDRWLSGLASLGLFSWSILMPMPPLGFGYRLFYGPNMASDKEASTIITPSPVSFSAGRDGPGLAQAATSSPPLGSPSLGLDLVVSIAAGVLLTFISIFLSSTLSVDLEFSPVYPLCIMTAAAAFLFNQPSRLRSARRYGIALGCLLASAVGFTRLGDHWAFRFLQFMLAGAVFTAAYYDSACDRRGEDRHMSMGSSNSQAVDDAAQDWSALTAYLISRTEPGSLVRTILSQQDSRQIAYFGCLNLAFMLVQFCYGFLTGSLGLLTDSIHMLFDCAGLAVGLAAAVMSKWAPTATFPYGYGKVETLSGFANGVFLILVSVEIVFDAIERLKQGYEVRRLNELLVVSILGFIVNIVGLTAFGHAHHHHGYDHDHGHGHAHGGHNHGHNHSHGHNHGPAEPKTSSASMLTPDTPTGNKEKFLCPTTAASPIYNRAGSQSQSQSHFRAPSILTSLGFPGTSPGGQSHGHGHDDHDHENENMEGIFLHILADALGSVSVIASTVLTKWTGWPGWDPLASCAISALIFVSAVPLVRRAGGRLLLALPPRTDWLVRQTLGELGNLPGVAAYRHCRFWTNDGQPAGLAAEQQPHGGHGHGHSHSNSQHSSDGHAACSSGHDHAGHAHQRPHSATNPTPKSLSHSHSHSHGATAAAAPAAPAAVKLYGVIHILTTPRYDLEDVRRRCRHVFAAAGFDVVVHVEQEADAAACWCAASAAPAAAVPAPHPAGTSPFSAVSSGAAAIMGRHRARNSASSFGASPSAPRSKEMGFSATSFSGSPLSEAKIL